MRSTLLFISKVSVLYGIIIWSIYGCSDVAPTNPYDPITPESQQIKGSVLGSVVLGVDDESLQAFERSNVLLFDLSLPLEEASDCSVDTAQVAIKTTALRPIQNHVANFELSNIQSGQYWLVICVLGYQTESELISVQRGQETRRSFTLSLPPQEMLESGVKGTILLAGQNVDDHSGVQVEAVGRPYSTQTTTEGLFNLPLTNGIYTLQVSKDGYQPQQIPNINVEADGYKDVEELTLQRDLSASLKGRVTSVISRFEWSLRSSIKIIGNNESRQTIPNQDGEFGFDLLIPGTYIVEVVADGHIRLSQSYILESGELEIEPIILTPQYVSREAIPMVGYALLSDQLENQVSANHLGTLVQAFADNTLIDSTETDESGLYVLPASDSLEYQLRFVRQGYESSSLQVVWQDNCERSTCFAPLVDTSTALEDYRSLILAAKPAQVNGSITLTPYTSPFRIQNTTITILDDNDMLMQDSSRPSVSGNFHISDLSSGRYKLLVESVGYEPVSVSFSLSAGEVYDVGQVSLNHQSITDQAVQFEGIVRLENQENHTGTEIQILTNGTQQILHRILTDNQGRFTVPLATDEEYRVSIFRRNYQVPSSQQLGAFSWQGEQFINERGEGLELTLTEVPLNGSISIPIEILPSWIPVEQRYAQVSVAQLNGNFQQIFDGVTETQNLVVSNLSSGEYVVTVSRSGFQSKTWVAHLDTDTPEANPLSPLQLRLSSLALARIDLEGRHLTACDLRLSVINEQVFSTVYRNADFSGATLSGHFGMIDENECLGCAERSSCGSFDLSGGNFTNTDLSNDSYGIADFSSSFSPVNLRGSQLFGARCDQVNFEGADLSYTNMFGVSAQSSYFAGANLSGANLMSADLKYARFAKVQGIYPNQLAYDIDDDGIDDLVDHPWAELHIPIDPFEDDICESGSTPSSAILDDVNFAQADLSHAILVGVSLSSANLYNTLLVGSDLRGSCLEDAQLNLVDLSGATLDKANADRASMINAILATSRLRGVRLRSANLSNAIMEQTDFSVLVPLSREDICWSPYPWCEYEESGCSDLEVGRCLNQSEDPRCFCRTSLKGADLNNSSIMGSNFDLSDQYNVSFLGANIRPSRQIPTRQPLTCFPEQIDSCKDFCELLINSLPEEEQDINCDEVIGSCVSLNQTEELIDSLNMRELNCTFNKFYANGETATNISQIIFGSNLCQEADFDLPQRPRKCDFDSIVETLRLEELNENCDQDTTIEGTFNCCPSAWIPRSCRYTNSTFIDTRMNRSKLGGVQFDQTILTNAMIEEADLQNTELFEVIMDHTSLKGSLLTNSNIVHSDLNHNDLTLTELNESSINAVNWSGANLSRTNFDYSTIHGGMFTHSYVEDGSSINASHSIFNGVDFGNQIFTHYESFDGIRWPGAFFEYTEFNDITMRDPILTRSLFRFSQINNLHFINSSDEQTLLDISSVEMTNSDIHRFSIKPESSYATFDIDHRVPYILVDNFDLSASNVYGFNLTMVELEGADLSDTQMSNVEWRYTHFSNANMENISIVSLNCALYGCTDPQYTRSFSLISHSQFSNCDLSGASFNVAKMTDSELRNCTLEDMRFEYTQILDTTIKDSSLAESIFIGVEARLLLTDVNLYGVEFLIDGQCGSKLSGSFNSNLGFSDIDLSGLDLRRSDLRGICNMQDLKLNGTLLEGARICAQHEDELDGYQGTPIWVECPLLPKCPTEADCRSSLYFD